VNHARLDLDADSRSALGWDELLQWVSSFAATVLGVRHVLALHPSVDPAELEARQRLPVEMRRLLEDGAVVRSVSSDPEAALAHLEVEDRVLDGKTARDLALLVDAAGEAGRRLRSVDAQRFPTLRAIGQEMPDLSAEAAGVLRGTDGEGALLDEASPELGRLRRGVARAGDRLRRLLTRYLRQPGSETVIRDDFITQRGGRFVVPVRTDAPRAVHGIVHASSSSGATQFVEPLESVEPNNELVRLRDEVLEEEQRVLAGWTEDFRSRLPELKDALAQLARVDAWQARVRFGDETEAQVAEVGEGLPLRLEELRHPLLLRRLREEGGDCVPSTIVLDPADRVLVLSGPNTGGKTVALKAIGLAALMAQSGIPVTARAARLPRYRQLRADIGDHQSIDADLSTYSAHVRAIGDAIRERRPTALFLFDELGTGTEPTEGAALARAILESLVEPGMTVAATTHLGPVKAWAVTAEGVECAALDFDPETLLPSYRVVMGVAGRSGGIDIAERLGIEAGIVGRARALLDPDQREGEEYLRRLRDAMAEAEAARTIALQEREALQREQESFREKQQKAAAQRAREADRKLSRVVDEFRRKARREVEALREDPSARARADRRRVRAERRMASDAVRARSELDAEPREAAPPTEPVDPARVAVGDRVWVRSLARTGEVRELLGEQVEVRLGSLALRVRRDELFRPPDAAPAVVPPRQVRVSAPSAPAPGELVLVGRRVEEALRALDRFLDAAQLAGQEEVRIVHGHGTGRLRAAVREHLEAHELVKSHRPGGRAEGGDGATVALLA
jgi:DNA mismatch repair protein MutS2